MLMMGEDTEVRGQRPEGLGLRLDRQDLEGRPFTLDNAQLGPTLFGL